jgi:predicted restriction endonuclease
MKYKCKFPGCTFETNDRSRIVSHHILPKSLGGSNKKHNLLYVCPNHHAQIYVEGVTSGIHSKLTDDSIIITNRLQSTKGEVIIYDTTTSKDNISLI